MTQHFHRSVSTHRTADSPDHHLIPHRMGRSREGLWSHHQVPQNIRIDHKNARPSSHSSNIYSTDGRRRPPNRKTSKPSLKQLLRTGPGQLSFEVCWFSHPPSIYLPSSISVFGQVQHAVLGWEEEPPSENLLAVSAPSKICSVNWIIPKKEMMK